MFSNCHTGQIGTGITDPGADKNEPHQIFSPAQFPGQIDKRKQHPRVKCTEKNSHHLVCMVFWKMEHIDEHHCQKHQDNCPDSPEKVFGKHHRCAIQHNSAASHDFQQRKFAIFFHMARLNQLAVSRQGKHQTHRSQNRTSTDQKNQRQHNQHNAAAQSRPEHHYSSFTSPYLLSL